MWNIWNKIKRDKASIKSSSGYISPAPTKEPTGHNKKGPPERVFDSIEATLTAMTFSLTGNGMRVM